MINEQKRLSFLKEFGKNFECLQLNQVGIDMTNAVTKRFVALRSVYLKYTPHGT